MSSTRDFLENLVFELKDNLKELQADKNSYGSPYKGRRSQSRGRTRSQPIPSRASRRNMRTSEGCMALLENHCEYMKSVISRIEKHIN